MPSASTLTTDDSVLLVQLSDSHLFAEADGTLLGMNTGDSLQRVQDWVRQYVGMAMDWDVNLIVKKEHRPRLRLGSTSLGWTSWLSSRAPQRYDRQLLIKPRPSFSSQGTAHG